MNDYDFERIQIDDEIYANENAKIAVEIAEKAKQQTFVLVGLSDEQGELELSGVLVSVSKKRGFELSVTLRVDIATALQLMASTPALKTVTIAADKSPIHKYVSTQTYLTTYELSNVNNGTCDLTIAK